MKLQERIKQKKSTAARKMVMILNEIQFRSLAQNVLSEQDMGSIKKTYLIKILSNAKKN
jgi:hypothetical protein